MPIVKESNSAEWLVVCKKNIAKLEELSARGGTAEACRMAHELECSAQFLHEELMREFHLAIPRKGV